MSLSYHQNYPNSLITNRFRVNSDDDCAEQALAADRFAREIVGFLKVVGGTLAAG
jgi:hypothetical protein